jgi:hypothetical protein
MGSVITAVEKIKHVLCPAQEVRKKREKEGKKTPKHRHEALPASSRQPVFCLFASSPAPIAGVAVVVAPCAAVFAGKSTNGDLATPDSPGRGLFIVGGL